MRAVSFVTPGLIDPRCISTLGVSVKENENPIGYFGTGLKYAISIILRNGGQITVWRGLEPIRFEAKEVSIRNAAVQVVCMNGVELGFTTQLGRNWHMWQAFREFYCNTTDEGGKAEHGVSLPREGHTTIVVEHEEMSDCLDNIGNYILQSKPIHAHKAAEFHRGPTSAIFYRTIKVCGNNAGKPSRFAANILRPLHLTEDRTVNNTWDVYQAIAHAVLENDDAEFIEDFITTAREFAEHEYDLDWSAIEPSETFLQVARRVAQDTSRPMNTSVKAILARHSEVPDVQPAEMLASEETDLALAISFCRELKYPVDEFPILVVEGLGEGILGSADKKAREIRIAKRAIQMGDLTLAATLIEEWAHIKFGFADCSREMQNWLFEQITRLGNAYLQDHLRGQKR